MTSRQNLQSRAKVTALGVYAPERVLSNHDLEQIVETNDEWIVQRTGIRERRVAAETEFTSDLCAAAARDLADKHGVSLEDVDFIIVSTTTPDHPLPSVSSQVQHQLGIPHAGAIDLQAACAGFVYGLHIANGLVTAGVHRKVLVIGGETLTKVTDFSDRATCILFGDGAGAALVEACEPEEASFLAAHVGSEGQGGKSLYRAGTSKVIGGVEMVGEGRIVQNGREVYKWAVNTLSREIPQWLEKNGYSVQDVDWFVPHSANVRIIEAVNDRLKFPMEKTLHSAEFYGNTSSATIPLALDEAVRAGRVKKGDKVLLFGFGGGLVYSGVLLEWGY